MREIAKKSKASFIQGEVIGFEFLDQSDHYSVGGEVRHHYAPRKCVVSFVQCSIVLYQTIFIYVTYQF